VAGGVHWRVVRGDVDAVRLNVLVDGMCGGMRAGGPSGMRSRSFVSFACVGTRGTCDVILALAITTYTQAYTASLSVVEDFAEKVYRAL
jgi:hypothetical protein